MNLHEFMCSYGAKMTKNANNLFEQQFLMHPGDFLYKISAVESSY
jgi:hypothetical protein